MNNQPNNTIKFSVVIPTKDRDAALLDCLRSVVRQTYSPHEVIVVDDGEIREEALALIRRIFAHTPINFRLLKKDKPGLSESKNLGATSAKGEIVVFLDDDVTLDPNYLKALASVWKNQAQDEQLVGVGGIFSNGRQISAAEKIFNRIFCLATNSHNKNWEILPWGFQTMNHYIDSTQEVDWLPGGNSSYRREIILQFPFSPLKPGRTALEDIDHSWKLKNEGYRMMLTPESRMIHWAVPTARENASVSGFKEANNRKIIFDRHGNKTLGNRFRFVLAATGSVLKKFLTGIAQPRMVGTHWQYGAGMIKGYLAPKSPSGGLEGKD